MITQTVGGWQDYRNLSMDPESDLWLRMYRAGFTFQPVNRLTAVKFPASLRKNCYRKRSSHEQQQWTDRILKEKDLEAVELAKIVAALDERRQLTLRFVLRSLPGKIKTEMRRLTRGLAMPLANGENVRERRRFKGLGAPD